MSGKFGSDEREIPDEKEVIRRQIDAMRDHVYSHIIWYEREFLIHLTFQMTFQSYQNQILYLIHYMLIF